MTNITTHWDPKDLLQFKGLHQQDGVVHVPGLVASETMAELLAWVDDISNASTLGRHYFESTAHGRGKARRALEHACGRAQRRFLVLCAQFPACMPAFRAVRR